MPTYEYECAKCKKEFEIFQSMKDDALKTCPKERCRMKTWGKGQVKRKLGVGRRVHLQGLRFLHHRLPQRGLQEIEERSRHGGAPTPIDEGRSAQSRCGQAGRRSPPPKRDA